MFDGFRRCMGLGLLAPLPMFGLLCEGVYAYGAEEYGGRASGWLGG